MPSASSKSSQPSLPGLLQEPMKGAVCVLEKKLRNLDKRKIKLEETRKKAELGDELNEDQQKALESLTLLENSLDTVKELHKIMCSLEQEYIRLSKKESKRVKQEQRDQADGRSQGLAYQIIQFQGILGDLSEEVRPDFLAGINGACKLTDVDLQNLDAIYELINPDNSDGNVEKLSLRVKTAGEHLINLVEGKDKPALENVTYKQLNEVLQRISDSGYFDKEQINGDEEAIEELPVSVDEIELPGTEEIAPDVVTPAEEYPQVEYDQTKQSTPEVTTPVLIEPVNGVDLPPEVQQTPEDEIIDFLSESQISTAPVHEGSLNPVSPEFIPRNLPLVQAPSDDTSDCWQTGAQDQSNTDSGLGDANTTNTEPVWQSVPDSHQTTGGNYRGRGGNGGGNRGFGRGRGRGGGGGGYRGGARQDGGRGGRGNYRGEGGNYRGNRGSRGGGGSRGGQRGGGPREGGPREGGPREGGPREGGFNKQSPQ